MKQPELFIAAIQTELADTEERLETDNQGHQEDDEIQSPTGKQRKTMLQLLRSSKTIRQEFKTKSDTLEPSQNTAAAPDEERKH